MGYADSGHGGSSSSPTYTLPADGPQNDAFGRQRISLPELRLSVLFDEGDRLLYWTGDTAGGGSYAWDADSNTVLLSVGTASGDRATRQTKEFFAYKAGQSQLAMATFKMADAQENLVQRVGYSNGDEGIYLEQSGVGEPTVNIKSTASGAEVIDSVAQSSWNVDPMDGSGPSGITLDLTKTQILVIDFQWLGAGRVRVGFSIAGTIRYVHEFLHANTATEPYLRSPKMPIRYEIENTGITAAPASLMQICASLIREGAQISPGVVRSIYSAPDASETSTTTLRTVLGIRLKAAHIHNTLEAVQWYVNNIDTEIMLWSLILNPGGTGAATWSDVPGADSITQYSRSQIAIPVNAAGLPTVSGGIVLASGGVPGGTGHKSESAVTETAESLPICASYDGTPDELWIAVRQVTGAGTVLATLDYKEIR